KFDGRWDDLLFMSLTKKSADGLAALSAVIEREVIDVHADEAVGTAGVEHARELHRIRQRFIPMIESVLNAFLDVFGNALDRLLTEIALDDVATERQRQSGLLLPPFTEVEHFMKSHLTVRQLAFMDQHAGFVFAALHVFENLIERHDVVLDLRFEQTKRQEGSRHRPRNRHRLAGQAARLHALS